MPLTPRSVFKHFGALFGPVGAAVGALAGATEPASAKPLLASKTANTAHGQLVGSLLAIYLLSPNTTWTVILVGGAVLVWAKDIILRLVTKGPVGAHQDHS